MSAAAAAAIEIQRRRQEEEEIMTPYQPHELGQDWEFKIIRSAAAGFKKPEYLKQVLEEEQRAGWILVEKFDNARVRLKRSASAKANDAMLDFDPYRTTVGMSENRIVAVTVSMIAAVVGGIVA